MLATSLLERMMTNMSIQLFQPNERLRVPGGAFQLMRVGKHASPAVQSRNSLVVLDGGRLRTMFPDSGEFCFKLLRDIFQTIPMREQAPYLICPQLGRAIRVR